MSKMYKFSNIHKFLSSMCRKCIGRLSKQSTSLVVVNNDKSDKSFGLVQKNNIRFLMKKVLLFFTVIIAAIFMFFQSYLFGLHDIGLLITILISTGIIFITMLEVQLGNKRTLRVNSKKDSWLYKYLSFEQSSFTVVTALLVSLLLSIISVLLFKSIIIDYGTLPILLGLIATSLVVFFFVGERNTSNNFVENNIHEDISSHMHTMMYIFSLTFMLNIIVSLGVSYMDMNNFFLSNITFDNLDQESIKDFIDPNGVNYYGKVIIDIIILVNNFKMALVSIFVEPSMKEAYYVYIYIGFLVLNIFKLFSLVFTLVFLQKGFEKILKSIFNKVRRN